MYYNPVKIIETNSWLNECNVFQKTSGTCNPIIITSTGNLRRQKLTHVFDTNSIFSDIEPNPSFENCQAVIDFSLSKPFDGVIALGGGSVMDAAKTAMAALGTGINSIEELLEFSNSFRHRVPAIFIPTTHGTGSEVTMWGSIWNMREKKKHSISHTDLYPNVAVLDGSLTLSLPLDISLTTLLDALSHSFEAIWSKNANPTSTDYAIQAICLILENVHELKKDLKNIQVRKSLIKAACIAGLAFSNTKTAAAHSISYPLTAHFGIPHGIACSLSLIPLLSINALRIEKPLASILKRLSMDDLEELRKIINEIPETGIKYSLHEWGVKHNDLEWLVDLTFTKERMDNNIVELTEDNVRWILEEIY